MDASITFVGLKSFYAKIVNDFDLDVGKASEYPDIFIKNQLFSEDIMLMTYPNMQIAGTKYNGTYVDSLYKNSKTYYVKLFSNN